jgi:type 1 glutamine amidotransferase
MARWFSATCLAGVLIIGPPAVSAEPAKTVALIAGTKSHGPGDHEYEKGMRLLKRCLESSPNVSGIRAEVYTDGWPADPKVLDDADAIAMFSDGSDRDQKAHPLLRDDRLATLDRLMKQGVGLAAIHYTVFVPSKVAGDRFLDNIGGYFDYENGPAANHWYSKIQTVTAPCSPASPGHPIARGLGPFDLKEEFYYNIRFRDDDPRLSPILTARIPGEPRAQVVAWAVQRADGGRGFGYTGGHFHANWGDDHVRKMVLNAILWTARAEVPEGGVSSTVPPDALKIGPASE